MNQLILKRKKHLLILLVLTVVISLACIILLSSSSTSAGENPDTIIRAVKQISTGKLILRAIPDFNEGEGITQASEMFNIEPSDLEEILVTIAEYELSQNTFDIDELPWSMHIAALKSVNVTNKTATVVRKYQGVNYEIPNCRISYQALTAYQAGVIKVFNPVYSITAPENADCFVLVYYISETPYDSEINIPVIIDKVVK